MATAAEVLPLLRLFCITTANDMFIIHPETEGLIPVSGIGCSVRSGRTRHPSDTVHKTVIKWTSAGSVRPTISVNNRWVALDRCSCLPRWSLGAFHPTRLVWTFQVGWKQQWSCGAFPRTSPDQTAQARTSHTSWALLLLSFYTRIRHQLQEAEPCHNEEK